MKPNIEISDKNLKEVSTLLNTLLADEYVLYTKTRNAHWNIQGQNFMELHKFFQGQYEELDETIDEIAERIRMLGHFPIGSLKDFLAISNLLENAEDFSNQKKIHFSGNFSFHPMVKRAVFSITEQAECSIPKQAVHFLISK
jgi:starvation-inducible DNA-binding protein